ncbi:MAG: FAD-dependent oxidoreductase [Pseudomonadota bacterium]
MSHIAGMTKSEFDIIIVGGGLAGGLTALALAQQNHAVALVEGQTPQALTDAPYDGRTTAIA